MEVCAGWQKNPPNSPRGSGARIKSHEEEQAGTDPTGKYILGLLKNMDHDTRKIRRLLQYGIEKSGTSEEYPDGSEYAQERDTQGRGVMTPEQDSQQAHYRKTAKKQNCSRGEAQKM